ncbi:hypothetical protein DPMN_128191 [Dreissena polymorpha]|uniref:G-protein coupled receptors family 1 profile domain-containing protein n=1 Tax=Dreissena polymorpha TaxID=45954 RepID=A0A9D4H6N4_DREPO|nr:hypothetical protein DPMN_128191 [Dreissena polymorpha]
MTPVTVISLYISYQKEKLRALKSNDPYTVEYIYFLSNVAVLVSYFNATFNFAIYVFSGSRFRAELRSLLCCKATQGTR